MWIRKWRVAVIGEHPYRMKPTVWLEREGRYCQASLLRDGAKHWNVADEHNRAPATTRPSQESGAGPVNFARYVQKHSDTEYVVERDVIRLAMGVGARHLGRLVPVSRGGHVSGYRLVGVRAGSLGAQLGLRNGDEIQLVNGKSVADTEGLLVALGQVSRVDTVQALVQRGGQSVEMTYRLN